MITVRKYCGLFLLFALMVVFACPVCAQVNWAGDMIRAKGSGAPPANMSAGQGKLMAKRAAVADAYRNLAEVVVGVRVDSQTTVKNFVTESDEINTKVQAFIKGAAVVSEQQLADGVYEVVIEAPIHGVGSLADVLLGAVMQGADKHVDIMQDMEVSGGDYTGIIIDARGTGFMPSLSPKIYAQNGDVVYDLHTVDEEVFVNEGVMTYIDAGSLEQILEGRGGAPFWYAFEGFGVVPLHIFPMPIDVKYAPVKSKAALKSKVGDNPVVLKAVKGKNLLDEEGENSNVTGKFKQGKDNIIWTWTDGGITSKSGISGSMPDDLKTSEDIMGDYGIKVDNITAQKLLKANTKSNFLKNGKVVSIIDPDW